MKAKALLTPWNLLGLLLFLLGLFLFLTLGQAPRPNTPGLALPGEEGGPKTLSLNLYRPTPPQGFRQEAQTLKLPLGENPYGAALKAWAEALGVDPPLGAFPVGKTLVVDLPKTLFRGVDSETEAYRLYSLAYTLLSSFPGFSEVRFLVEGEAGPGVGHLDLREGFKLP